MSEVKDKTPVGRAVYLEFRRASGYTSTFQIILTPAGVLSDGSAVDCVVYRRHISESAPRGQWRTSTIKSTYSASPSIHILEELLTLLNDSWSKSGINYALSSLFDTERWQLFKQPVVVEVSTDDLVDISKRETPTALIKRIRKARETLGFPESFYETTTPTPTPTPTTI